MDIYTWYIVYCIQYTSTYIEKEACVLNKYVHVGGSVVSHYKVPLNIGDRLFIYRYSARYRGTGYRGTGYRGTGYRVVMGRGLRYAGHWILE